MGQSSTKVSEFFPIPVPHHPRHPSSSNRGKADGYRNRVGRSHSHASSQRDRGRDDDIDGAKRAMRWTEAERRIMARADADSRRERRKSWATDTRVRGWSPTPRLSVPRAQDWSPNSPVRRAEASTTGRQASARRTKATQLRNQTDQLPTRSKPIQIPQEERVRRKSSKAARSHHSSARDKFEDEPKRKQEWSSRPTKNCMVCVENRTIRHFGTRPPTSQCQHEVNICRRCLRAWIKSEFTTKIWNQIKCPECAITMEYADIQEFAPADIFRRYDKLSTKAAIESLPGFRWCIAKGCGSGQIHGDGDANPKFRCLSCNYVHCIIHNRRWHKGETCAEYDYRTDGSIKKAEEEATKRVIKETAKRCPGCKTNIQKHYGCDHMTCVRCKHEFCWVCLADYEPIRTFGNAGHRVTCMHYLV